MNPQEELSLAQLAKYYALILDKERMVAFVKEQHGIDLKQIQNEWLDHCQKLASETFEP